MTKNLWAGLIALILVIAAGITEVAVLNNRYESLHDECGVLLEKALAETVTEEEFEQFEKKWVELRETSELLLPHLDVYELNLRVAETSSYVLRKDYKAAHAQLAIIYELLDYIPHLMVPDLKHIV